MNLLTHLDALEDALQDNLRWALFYHYPRGKALLLVQAEENWAAPLKQFPSVKEDLMAGLDCYALGHNMGCVFYFMRVAEFGLRIVAAERQISSVRSRTPVDRGTWGQVIEAIEKKAEAILQAKAGPEKDAALKFYNSVIADLWALLEVYRNDTSHLRGSYDEGAAQSGAAQSAMFRVKELMMMLSGKLDEGVTAEIDWGLTF